VPLARIRQGAATRRAQTVELVARGNTRQRVGQHIYISTAESTQRFKFTFFSASFMSLMLHVSASNAPKGVRAAGRNAVICTGFFCHILFFNPLLFEQSEKKRFDCFLFSSFPQDNLVQ